MRAKLPPHPTAKHTWAKPPEVSEFAHFDELPMAADSEVYEHTDKPRHRAIPLTDDVWLTGSTADEARVMRQDDARVIERYQYAIYRDETVRVLSSGMGMTKIVRRSNRRSMVPTVRLSGFYLGTPLPVFE